MKRSPTRTAILLGAALCGAGCVLSSTPTGPAGLASKTVTTLVGQAGTIGSADGTGTAATLGFPAGVVVGPGAVLYVCDSFNSTIRAINLGTGAATTIAGVPGVASWFDNTAALAAFFNHPEGIATDGTNLYVADSGNNAIRKIVLPGGPVTTIAGNPNVLPGSADGIGSAALFNNPLGICFDSANSILYVTDSGNSTLRAVPTNGTSTSTVAGQAEVFGSSDGTGTAATFTYPEGIVIDGGNANLYVTDTGNGTIRRLVIASKAVTTLAGQTGVRGDVDGPGAAAQFNWPEGIAIDSTDMYLYVADTLNNVIRQVVIGSGAVTTLAGQGETAGSADGAGDVATFNHPMRLVFSLPSLYVGDTYNETIRRVSPMP